MIPAGSGAEKRLVVAGIDNNGHLSYCWRAEKPLYTLDVTRPALPKSVKITNRTGMEVKVYQYNGSDGVRLISKRGATLKSGKSVSWPYQVFHIKVFKRGFPFEKWLADGLSINSNVFLDKVGGRVKVKTIGVPVFTVTNNTKETIHANIYNPGDNLRWIPKKTIELKPGTNQPWPGADASKMKVRIHRAAFLGEPLTEAEDVNARSSITVGETTWSPWKKLTKSDWAGGRRKDTAAPKPIPAIDGLYADIRGYAFGNGQWWPQIFGLAAGSAMWNQLLVDEPAGDATVVVNRSTTWRLIDQNIEDTLLFAGQIASTPAIVSDNDSFKDGEDKVFFARSPNGTLITKRFFSGINTINKGAWQNLGGNVDSAPAAVAYGGGRPARIMAFIRDPSNNTLRMRERGKDGKWGGWVELGGEIQGSPFATSGSHGVSRIDGVSSRVDVFARGLDNTLHQRTYKEGIGWGPWAKLGGTLGSSPVAHCETEAGGWPTQKHAISRFDVFALDSKGDVVHRRFNGEKWLTAHGLAGGLRSAPIVFLSDDSA